MLRHAGGGLDELSGGGGHSDHEEWAA